MQLHDSGVHSKESCTAAAGAIRDTLYVLGGKWKLPIIMALAGAFADLSILAATRDTLFSALARLAAMRSS